MVRVGDRVNLHPVEYNDNGAPIRRDTRPGRRTAHEPLEAVVVYNHPRGRFAVVEFRYPHGAFRETFMAGDLPARRKL